MRVPFVWDYSIFPAAVSLFSLAAVKEQLSSRIESLLNVPVAANDGLPQHICARGELKLWREPL